MKKFTYPTSDDIAFENPMAFEIMQAMESGDDQRAAELIELRDSIDWQAADEVHPY